MVRKKRWASKGFKFSSTVPLCLEWSETIGEVFRDFQFGASMYTTVRKWIVLGTLINMLFIVCMLQGLKDAGIDRMQLGNLVADVFNQMALCHGWAPARPSAQIRPPSLISYKCAQLAFCFPSFWCFCSILVYVLRSFCFPSSLICSPVSRCYLHCAVSHLSTDCASQMISVKRLSLIFPRILVLWPVLYIPQTMQAWSFAHIHLVDHIVMSTLRALALSFVSTPDHQHALTSSIMVRCTLCGFLSFENCAGLIINSHGSRQSGRAKRANFEIFLHPCGKCICASMSRPQSQTALHALYERWFCEKDICKYCGNLHAG